ncbi:hypothetical protein [Photobacterium sp. GSS17]|uniref:hypothetical protein n=1 Tax=Photobacterium sp. GSS17 TaxID=3020715 RepID=UPI00235EC3EB|nr:hypothetical protein [Photobacterium sp. GSS17]
MNAIPSCNATFRRPAKGNREHEVRLYSQASGEKTEGCPLMPEDSLAVLYQHARQALDDELKYQLHLDKKAAGLLGVHSAVIAGFTVLVFLAAAVFFPPSDVLSWVATITVVFTYAALLSAWSFLFRTLRPRCDYGLDLPPTWLNEIKQYGYEANAELALARCYEVWQQTRKGNAARMQLLNMAYHEIVFSAWLIAISLLFLLVTNFFDPFISSGQ